MPKEYWIHDTDKNGQIRMEKISLQKIKREIMKNLTSEEITEILIERAEEENKKRKEM